MQEFSTRDLAVVGIRGKDGVNRGKEFIVASAYCTHESKSPPEEVQRLTRYCREREDSGSFLDVMPTLTMRRDVARTQMSVGRNSWIIWLRKTL